MRPSVAALVALSSVAACMSAPPPATLAPLPSCERGDTAMVRDVIYFGRNRPEGGVVTDAEWEEFLDSVVTPRFPAGFTVVEAEGHWRGAGGLIERERTEVVTLLHPGDAPSRLAVAELAVSLVLVVFVAAPSAAHELGLTRVTVTFSSDATVQADVLVDPESLLAKLEILAGQSPTLNVPLDELPARISALESVVQQRTRLLFDGERIPLAFTYIPGPRVALSAPRRGRASGGGG